ncbi:MAG: PA14 domain-containing protein, partial [Chloroflexota bacterium]|nr:PA14 domain-containing protein [Chloroflexota bacterium]
MRIFGTDLFGLRMFSTLIGIAMLVPFYLLVRLWFGVRTAIIATTFLAISDVTIHFSRQEFSNITTPFFLTTGFYFLFRGLRTKRTLDFVLSGYAHMLSLYFYQGGRLTPILLAAVFAYLFVLIPLVRLPGTYYKARKLTPGLSRFKTLWRAAWAQGSAVLHYFPQVLIFAIACFCAASPFLVYFLDHQGDLNQRAGEKLIFNNEPRMVSQYHVTHDPLYVGVRMPRPDDIYPVLPVAFEQTPFSVKLSEDGFWPRVLWNQTTTTLSMLTYRAEASSVYTFAQAPVAKPIEAALIILGIAWALWRWRDTRMGVLSMWFWSTVFSGGVLTIDAPYMARLIGIVPVMAIFAAVPLTKLSAEFGRVVGGLGKVHITSRVWARVGQVFSGAALAGLLGYLAWQNFTDYYMRYLATWPFPDVTGQAAFVRQMNNAAASEGRPQPKYYDIGIHMIYWGHGDNRFINHGTEGTDMANPANDLPVLDSGDRDLVFMVWDLNRNYLGAIRQYYPMGEEGGFVYGPPGSGPLFTYYLVRKEQIDALHSTTAAYAPVKGSVITRDEPAFGTTGPPPDALQYPVAATWTGGIFMPAYGRYSFSLDTAGDGSLVVDGTPVLTTTASTTHAEGQLLLARGPHEVKLTGVLADARSPVSLQWSTGASASTALPRQFIWRGQNRALLGEVRQYTADLLAPTGDGKSAPLIASRVDGFLGFRNVPAALGGGAFTASWVGMLDIQQAGTYGFDLNSDGDSVVLVDDKVVVNNVVGGSGGPPHQAGGQAELTVGRHRYEVRYNWASGTGYLEAYWTPPGGLRSLIGADALSTSGGIVPPDAVAIEPPVVQLQPSAPPAIIAPDAVIGGEAAGLVKARGLAVDGAGNIYVGDRGNGRIIVLSPDGKVLRTMGKLANSPPPS